MEGPGEAVLQAVWGWHGLRPLSLKALKSFLGRQWEMPLEQPLEAFLPAWGSP